MSLYVQDEIESVTVRRMLDKVAQGDYHLLERFSDGTMQVGPVATKANFHLGILLIDRSISCRRQLPNGKWIDVSLKGVVTTFKETDKSPIQLLDGDVFRYKLDDRDTVVFLVPNLLLDSYLNPSEQMDLMEDGEEKNPRRRRTTRAQMVPEDILDDRDKDEPKKEPLVKRDRRKSGPVVSVGGSRRR